MSDDGTRAAEPGGWTPRSTTGTPDRENLTRSAYDATGREKFLDVSSQELQRFWANHPLVEKGVNPRVVMRLGD